ncbi:hypothetical protein HMPREF1051_2821, partial [Neisseria sicca VK64]
IRSVIAGSIPAAGNGVNPANLAAHLFYGSRRMPEGITLTFHVKKPYPFKY